MEVFFENVGPVDEDEYEDGKETETSGREYFFGEESSEPGGMIGVECHDGMWHVGWLEP